MPTLIRLLVFLLILAGLGFGAMVGLTAVVDPGQKEMRVRIPASDLMMTNESGAPVTLRDQLPSPKVTEPGAETAPALATPPAPSTPPSTSSGPAPDMSTFE